MFLLKLIFFLFIFGVIAVVFTIARVWWSVRNMQNQLRRKTDDASGYSSGRSTTTGHGDTITDTRSTERTSRKIIGDDEGEYVDFEEEK